MCACPVTLYAKRIRLDRRLVSTLLTVLTYVILMLLGGWLMGGIETPKGLQPPSTLAAAIDSPSAPTSSEGPQSLIK